MGALVRGLVDSHPERLLWGSDWPHTELFSSVPDDADLIDELMAHLSGEALRRTILIDNATSLFFSN
jgi:predicted TIM-barrel fold metal-dependent hydrolase